MTDPFGPDPAEAVFDDMVDLRQTLHRRPELAFAEHETTALIRDHMASLGIPETLRTTETGGIFTMEGGRPGRSVVLRGDIDGLPVQEDEARRVHSEVEGVMHACGHDVHVASLLGAASLLAARREDLPGRYVFLFQPAEEALCGAKAMLEAGALTAMEGARLVGFHVTSQLPSGFVALRVGHRHVRGQLPPHHPDRAGWARRHALGDGRRHPGHGGAGQPSGRGGHGAALRGDRLRVQRRHDPRRHGGQRGADLGPGHRHAAHLHRGPARGGAGPPAGPVRPAWATTRASTWSWRCPSTPAPSSTTPRRPPWWRRRRASCSGRTRSSGCRRSPRATTSASSSATCRVATSSSAAGAADGSSGMHHSPTFLVEDESLRVGANVLVRSALALAAP